jgi:hypothetical protein
MIVKFKDAEGHSILINSEHVIMVAGIKAQGQWILGKCAIVMINGTTVAVEHAVEEVYGALRRPEARSELHAVEPKSALVAG